MPTTFTPTHPAEAQALFSAPTGPVWECDGDDILDQSPAGGRSYLVRRLPNADSMLRVGPVLAQVTRFDHPRMWGPSFWSRDDDGLWIATPRPRGQRLGACDLERLSFGEALELWRPVAEAVKRMHRRGLVHGALTPWSLWVDQPAWKAAAIDAGCWVGEDFAGLDLGDALWLAPEMRGRDEPANPGPVTDVYGLARLLLVLALPAEQAAEARPSLTGIPAYAIPAIEAAIQDERARRPARVAELLGAMVPRSLHQVAADDDSAAADETSECVSVLHARVAGIERLEHPKLGAGVKFWLHRPDQSEPVGAFFYEKKTPEVYDSVKWVWEGCELNLIDARIIENSSGARFVTGARATLPVLEPHMPMSVSDVLKAEGCPSRFLVDQRDRGGSSRPLVFGNLVHGLLDDLVEPDPPTFEEAYSARVRELRVDMLAAGLDDGDLGALRQDARNHFDNIRRFTAPRTTEATSRDRVGWSGRNVEVTRYSTRYGIEGRVDLVAEDAREGLQIIELKSGSTWDGHLSQLRFYTFLWEGLAKKRGLEITGHVMYSRHGRMKVAPMEDSKRERRILRARNELIACLRSFVDPNYEYEAPFYMQFPRACRAGSCKFRRGRCREQTQALGLAEDMSPWDAGQVDLWSEADPELVARVWAWHEHLSRLIEMERWAKTVELGAVLNPDRLSERKQNYAAADKLRLVSAMEEAGYIVLAGEHAQIFSPGDYVVAHRGDFDTAHILRGKVIAIEGDRMTLSTRGAAIADELASDGWILDKLPARIGFRQAHHALYGAVQGGGLDRAEVLFRPEGERARTLMTGGADTVDLGPGADALNRSQREAVRLAVDAPAGALIQGPPGTGKTTVIAHAVCELVARGKRVLLSAFTNTAVDTILTKLLDVGFGEFLRVGRSSRSLDLCRGLEAEGYEPAGFFSTDLGEQTDSLDELARSVLTRSVVASTAHRCVSSPVFEFLGDERGQAPFDVAIVDEAGQITEPMSLAALNLGERFVLVGDDRQLPPIVENEQTHSHFVDDPGEELSKMGTSGLDQSLFERLVAHLPSVMLAEQYRMHADIMAFSNRAFYDGGLSAHESVRAHTLSFDVSNVGEILAPDRPFVFVDVDHDDHARHNQAEAEALVATLGALFEAQEVPASIGVVSPFRAQVYLIRRLLAERHPQVAKVVDVDTVERFQGSERDSILVSLVKTERAGDFLADERRLNVTLTRARKKLVVFGSRACLELHPLYRGLIEQPETHTVSWSG